MDDRKFLILQAIIDDYILTAMPVGSRTISRKEGIGLSSATIRNEMSDLEELGYLDQPHTSAGRVPSWKAYRWYVDQLMRVTGLPVGDVARIRSLFSHRMRQMQEMAAFAAQTIAELTNYTAVVLPPQEAEQRLKRAQLVRVSDDRALLVLVTDGGQTNEAMVGIPRDLTDDHLYALSGLITRHIEGRTGSEMEDIIRSMASEMADHTKVFENLAGAIESAVTRKPPQVVLGGAAQLLSHPEYADIEKARTVLGALETKERLAQMLTSRAGMELSISIGPEIDVEGMQDCSLVTVSYRMDGGSSGAMGVIGPTRMRYARVLAVLDGMKQAMNQVYQSQRENQNDEEDEN